MKTIAIHQKGDWYLTQLTGLGEIKEETIYIDFSVSDDTIKNLNYKDLRDVMVMERYFEKQQRQDDLHTDKALKEQFREKFNLTAIHSMDDVMRLL